jgi:subtilisin-like proprotein convertase family protein
MVLKMTKQALAIAVMTLGAVVAAQGQFVTNTPSVSVNSVVPSGNPDGMTSQISLSSVAGTITSVTVNLDITGGFNGNLYAYLSGPSGEFTVLLNRVGVSSTNSFGYGDSGFDITLSDASANNIHDYQLNTPSFNGSGQLTNTWAPDGRNIDPLSSGTVFDTTTPTADLSSFNGNGADGTWTLFLADLSSGGDSTLVSWGLTVVTVPEPQTWVMVVGGIGVLVALNRRRNLGKP